MQHIRKRSSTDPRADFNRLRSHR